LEISKLSPSPCILFILAINLVRQNSTSFLELAQFIKKPRDLERIGFWIFRNAKNSMNAEKILKMQKNSENISENAVKFRTDSSSVLIASEFYPAKIYNKKI
jgi:hypothetical protein